MFLVFALLILALWVWLFLNVYASFFPFLQSIGHISDYNVAYYSALSAVERGMLVTKYRYPGFMWSWWIMPGVTWWPLSDQEVFFVTWSAQSNRWSVASQTTSIPSSGAGNTDPFLSTGDSVMYNALRYDVSEKFLFSIDTTTGTEQFYSWSNQPHYFDENTFSGEIRLPPFVFAHFGPNGDLCDDNSSPTCDSDGDGVYDEIKIMWGIQGSYIAPSLSPFSIIPKVSIFYYSGMRVNYPQDNTMRASLLAPSLHVEPNGFTLVPNWTALTWHTIISPVSTTLQSVPFQDILGDASKYTDIEMSLGLVGLLRSFQWAVYPYLEYRFEFPAPIADRFFTIEWHGRNRDYDIEIQIKKPTVQGTVGGNFTVIF